MDALPFSQLPGMNALFLDYIEHPDRVSDFYPSREKIPQRDVPHRSELVRILRKQNEGLSNKNARSLLEKLETAGTFCVVTGQQVGLLTGPLYSIWKALTAIDFCRRMEQNGTPCVPVFWMASEDHNWHEIMNFALLKQDFELLEFSLKDHLFLSRQPTGSAPTTHKEVRNILIRALVEIKIPEVKEIYSKGNLASAFARTLLWLLQSFPILIVDPSDPELKKLAAPFFARFFERNDRLLEALTQQNERLKSLHYPVQVTMEENALPLFYMDGNERSPLKKNETHSVKAIEHLSPAALLRPLFQDFLFPTLAYVGGPGEISYFAQLHPWYAAMDMEQPWLLPRASITLIPPLTKSFLESKSLKPQELFIKEDTLYDALLDNDALNRIRQKVKDLDRMFETEIGQIKGDAEQIEKTLLKTISTSERKIKYQLKKLERKSFYAAKRKDQLLSEQIRKARNVIYPEEKLQERYLNIFSFSSRLPDLIADVYSKIDFERSAHQWIYI